MDFNFPELLAGDLGRSEDVFRSKNLTAGAPAASLAGDGCARRYSLQDSSAGLFSPQTRDILSRMQSLQMVNQDTYSQVIAAAQMHEESRKSSDTTTATESSGGMEPLSIAGRDVSVLTAATSVSSRSSPSDKSNSPVDKISNHSWVDLELEDTLNLNSERFLSFRTMMNQPSTPLSLRDPSGEARSMSMGYNIKGPATTDPFSAFSSPAKSFTAATMQPRGSHTYESVRIKQPIDFPARRSSLTHNSADLLSVPYHQFAPRSPTSLTHFTSSHVPRLSPIATSTRPSMSSDRASSHQDEETEEARSMLSLDDDSDDESDMMMAMNLMTPADRDDIAAPTIVSPLADLEQWMNQSTIELPHLLQPSKDYQGSRIPIAPEVLDTLRISVACFPETMLLCSSLSIETLRGHARKIRYRHPNIHTGSQLSLDLPDDTKQSKWKWLNVRRQPESSPTKLRSDHMDKAIGTSTQLGSPDWHSMKNIFPNGTDHLCDALYAHILAYNYISFLCPLSAVVTQAARPASTESSQPSESDLSLCRPDGNKIPPKAASLLGLQNNPPTTKARAAAASSKSTNLRGKKSFIKGRRENTKSFGPTASRSADDHDQSLKELRLGLAKCIARLVSTLRLTSNEEQGVSSKPVDIKDVDPLFIRALCEVVRCNEERS